MPTSYKDNVNAYNPPNWGQKYSEDVSRKLSKGAFTWKDQKIQKGEFLGPLSPTYNMIHCSYAHHTPLLNHSSGKEYLKI